MDQKSQVTRHRCVASGQDQMRALDNYMERKDGPQ